MSDHELREFLAGMLDWQQAHASFDSATADMPAALRGQRAEGVPHSVWEMVEHVRLAQRDILDFCLDPAYEAPHWPDDYWPAEPAPASVGAWDATIAQYHADVAELQRLVRDADFDPFATVPWGSGQTYIREITLVFDHTAYHVGQIVLTRRLLGAWK
ncbi:MAG: DinB family protein [Gemmatimonadaceae bacterium]